jgi:hypothetical protein
MVQQGKPVGKSKVARLMQQIEEEYTAANRGLHEYATVGRHEIITNRFDRAGQYIDQLALLVGEQEAQYISARIYIQVSEGKPVREDQAVACGRGPVGSGLAPDSTLQVFDPTLQIFAPILQVLQAEEDTITINAHLKWEGVQFLRDHGCHIEHYATGDRITFPARTRKTPLTRLSKHCNTITLPDATEITSIDGETTSLLLLIDPVNKQTVYLTL